MKIKALCVVLVPVVAIGALVLRGRSGGSAQAPAPAFRTGGEVTASGSAAQLVFVELHAAIEQGLVTAAFQGNGRDLMRATLTNTSGSPVKVQAEAGQTLESDTNAVVIIRPAMVEVAAGKSATMTLHTCATRSTNKIRVGAYKLSSNKPARLQPLVAFAQEHPELSAGTVQTAALALAENLPLSAVSKFTPSTGELQSRFNTDAFRVEVADLIGALAMLREIGIADTSIAMTVDPQLKIEAMIDPLSRAAAMRYYGISAEREWDFWKTELLHGAPATRHYALYGIARFYPEIALQMLPAWARETKTNAVYRVSSLQALADTQRTEALPILRQLADELGAETELGRAARGAADALNERLNQLATKQTAVAFRASKTLSQF